MESWSYRCHRVILHRIQIIQKHYSNSMTYSGATGNTNVTGGISVQMKAGKKWSIESGVYYSQNGQRSTNSSGFIFIGR